tara:strand:+ start:192 stop:635 length:444 start_codon:yes stop_codon:yes gene_type:complete
MPYLFNIKKQFMKAPLNTDNWSGSIKSNKAPLNTDDWNGFISSEMARKLSQNCQCVKAPCNCGVIDNVPTLPPMTVNLGCERADQIQKYGSYDACMKAREKEMSEQIFSEDDLGKMKSTLKKQKTKKYLIYLLIAVAGYFAYKKFRK